MHTKNLAGVIIATLLIFFIGYILYWGSTKPVSVIVQAGHEERVKGNTGATGSQYKETEWNTIVANEVARQLTEWNIDVKRIPAKVPKFSKAKIAVSIHFDSAKKPCRSGASIGYPDKKSYDFARNWEGLYKDYFPFGWHKDNFTENLKNYYAYKKVDSEKFLVLELGEITCEKQTKWLKPRLDKIAHLVAYAIAKELGKDVPKPNFP
jgi:N-acetylmuramoyl-L-alanine amidase